MSALELLSSPKPYRLTIECADQGAPGTAGSCAGDALPLILSMQSFHSERALGRGLLVGEFYEGLPEKDLQGVNHIVAIVQVNHLAPEYQCAVWEPALRALSEDNRALGGRYSAFIEKRFKYDDDSYRPIRRGKIKQISFAAEEPYVTYTIVIADIVVDPWKRPQANVKGSAVMLITLGVILWRAVDCFQLGGTGYGFVRMFNAPHALFDPASMAFLFIACHHFRMLCGVEFATFDESFEQAKQMEDEAVRHRRQSWSNTVLAFTVGSSVLTLYTLGLESAYGLICVLAVQCLLVFSYVKIYWKEFFTNDTEKGRNIFFIINDVVLLLIICVSMVVFVDAGLRAGASNLASYLIAGYVSILAVEFGLEYWKPLKKSVKDLFFPVRQFCRERVGERL